MNQTELNKLNAKMAATQPKAEAFGITTFDWSDNDLDRTLLYGYDTDRNTWHVYVKDKRVYLHLYNTYKPEVSVVRDVFESFQELVPNKRLYPERCDYEFCLWLIRDKGVHMTFLKWDRELTMKVMSSKPEFNPYYGKPANT